MTRLIASILMAIFCAMRAASAQQSETEAVWVQIEALRSLPEARARAQIYSTRLADVSGFDVGRGWYGIVLGPYARNDAERILRIYRAERRIPQDSFLTRSRDLGAQFWPAGANLLNRGALPAPAATAPLTPPTDVAPVQPEPADETLAEARRSEQRLSAADRRLLQTALKAAGHYTAAIDGAFGPGTRRSMADWQAANNFPVTGILTTAQRQRLVDHYNAPLISVGMAQVVDDKAGIAMQMPLKAVRFARHKPPIAHYDPISDLGARVLLISQPGDQTTLFGLYDILQTLELLPLEGLRERGRNGFTIEGRGQGIVSYAEARLEGGEIKGFMLVWPSGDEARRLRVLEAMRDSFTRLPGTLDPAEDTDGGQSIDLVAGLEIRAPRISRSGFYIDGKGTVVTTAEAVLGCTRITLDQEYQAELVTKDDALGVAVLRPLEPLAPISVARFSATAPRLQSDVAVAGYSYGGMLGAPTLTFGTLADHKGLRGETELTRLALAPLPGDAGGPVFDAGGGVLGMLLPPQGADRQLPQDVSFAAGARAIRDVLVLAGLSAEEASAGEAMAPEDLSRMASGMTVLVSCWD